MSTENKKTWKLLGILSIIFGVMGVILSLVGTIGLYTSILGLLLGIGSIVMATKQNGKMIAAIIGIVLSLLGSYWGYNAMKAWEKVGEELNKSIEDGTFDNALQEALEENNDNH